MPHNGSQSMSWQEQRKLVLLVTCSSQNLEWDDIRGRLAKLNHPTLLTPHVQVRKQRKDLT